jgi:sugar/nucleoside kinase (ribokinase family)
MTDRATLARQAALGLRSFADQRQQHPVIIGFDGFVDSIIAVVDKRYDAQRFDPVDTIAQFGKKISAAAGQSSNYELVVKLEKLGGNGPIMANAMVELGLPVTYIGCLGHPSIHHVFQDLAQRAECLSITGPGLTDALEFRDGKLMLGKHQTLKDVNWERICQVIGADRFGQIIGRSRLIGIVNWTMLPHLNGIWQRLVDDVLPGQSDARSKRRLVFIDLADPEKRTVEDLRGALRLCSALQNHVDVILGLNLKEAVQVAGALGLDASTTPEEMIEPMARTIRNRLQVNTVVIHPRGGAAAASHDGGETRSAEVLGPFVAQPRLSTGAGDLFNAGFCLGRMAGLPLEQALCTGTAASGYYVRNAASPTLDALAGFLDAFPEPEAGKTTE